MQLTRFGPFPLNVLEYADDLDGGLIDHIRGKVKEGLELRVTFDSFDFQVLANIIVNCQPYNQNKLGDVCQYLTYLTQLLVKVSTSQPDEVPTRPNASAAEVAEHASQVLKDHHIPLAGDLLGRERVTGAKKTRAGCDYQTDRFDHIVETPAVWHAKQSFLCVGLFPFTLYVCLNLAINFITLSQHTVVLCNEQDTGHND